MVVLLKLLSILFVGAVMLVGLLINGDRLYGWIGQKFSAERDGMQATLDLIFIQISIENLTRYYVAYLFGLFALGVLLLLPSILGGFVFGVLFATAGFKLPFILIKAAQKRRTKKFVLQMVDGLSLMSNAMRSGLNVPQALQLVGDELSNPISQEFGMVLSQNKIGVSLEDAIANLAVRMPHDDIEMFTTSVNILKETGGNLAETFDTISFTIRERIKIESKISAMVSQGVMQGVIVVLMPFALGGILYTIDPERIAPMFTTVPGWILLSAMMLLQFLGGYTIWKIVQVKV